MTDLSADIEGLVEQDLGIREDLKDPEVFPTTEHTKILLDQEDMLEFGKIKADPVHGLLPRVMKRVKRHGTMVREDFDREMNEEEDAMKREFLSRKLGQGLVALIVYEEILSDGFLEEYPEMVGVMAAASVCSLRRISEGNYGSDF